MSELSEWATAIEPIKWEAYVNGEIYYRVNGHWRDYSINVNTQRLHNRTEVKMYVRKEGQGQVFTCIYQDPRIFKGNFDIQTVHSKVEELFFQGVENLWLN